MHSERSVSAVEKDAKLLLLQVDHLSGEEMGHLIESMYGLGAMNVNVVSTITKKNRPGFLVLVDMGSKAEPAFSAELASTFGISGYHRINTVHCRQVVDVDEKNLVIHHNGLEIETTIKFKRIGTEDQPLFVRTEFSDLKRLSELIRESFCVSIPLPDLSARLDSFLKNLKTEVIEL